MTTTTAALTLALACLCAAAPAAESPVRIIFDTDIQGDVDDVGAVACLHALADRGEAHILAMGVSCKNPWSPLCLDALNVYFGRPDIPIGVVKGEAFRRRSRYAKAIAEEFPRNLESAEDAPDAALLYRRVLAAQPDASVVLCSVGQLPNFANLLRTKPDDHSPLDGVALVRKKVRAWVCMGGKMPRGREANLANDPDAAVTAIEHWPGRIIFSGWEIGNKIGTGARCAELPETSPVRRAYQLYNGLKDRQSWDQTAVLYAVRGLDGGLEDYWDLHTDGHMHLFPDARNEWRASPDRPHAYLVEKMAPRQIAREIEHLMLHQPKGRGE
ncbi:MAG: nucleoside hydrolase [Candidatus Brocadiia bacterium]